MAKEILQFAHGVLTIAGVQSTKTVEEALADVQEPAVDGAGDDSDKTEKAAENTKTDVPADDPAPVVDTPVVDPAPAPAATTTKKAATAA